MTRAIVRLSLRTSWLGDRAAFLRSLLISAAVALAVAAAITVAGAGLMLQRVADRAEARAFAPTSNEADVAARRHVIFDATPDGDQIYIYWWAITDPDLRIPGIPPTAAVGEWYVSPELARRIASDDLESRFPGAQLIGREGVAHADELIAHRIVSPRAELPETMSARTSSMFYLGDGADIEADSAVGSALALFVIPIIGLLTAAVAIEAVRLDHRLGVLQALGANAFQTASLVAVQTMMCALPGAVLGAYATRVWLENRSHVPFVGRAVLVGDLRVPVPLVATVALLVCIVAAVAAVVRPRRDLSVRPTDAAVHRPGWLRLVPLATGLVLMLLGGGVLGQQRDQLFIAGYLATAVGSVLALPVLYRHVGNYFARLPSVLSLLIGRRLTWNARSASRPLLIFGAMAVIVPVAVCWVEVGRVRSADEYFTFDVEPVEVNGVLPDGELDELTQATSAVPVTLAITGVDSPEPTIHLSADCDALGTVLAVSCENGRFIVAADQLQGLARYHDRSAGDLVGMESPPAGAQVEATLFLSEDWRRTERVLRAHFANRSEPGPSMGYVVNPLHEAPILRWVLGGFSGAAAMCAAALGLHLISQSARLSHTRRRLLALGSSQSSIRRLAGAESALTIALAGGACLALGTIASWCFVQMNPDARIPTTSIGVVSLVVLIAAAVCAMGAMIGVREPEVAARD